MWIGVAIASLVSGTLGFLGGCMVAMSGRAGVEADNEALRAELRGALDRRHWQHK